MNPSLTLVEMMITPLLMRVDHFHLLLHPLQNPNDIPRSNDEKERKSLRLVIWRMRKPSHSGYCKDHSECFNGRWDVYLFISEP